MSCDKDYKKSGERWQWVTAGDLRKKKKKKGKEATRGRGKEGDKVGEKEGGVGREGTLEAREKLCCSLMA